MLCGALKAERVAADKESKTTGGVVGCALAVAGKSRLWRHWSHRDRLSPLLRLCRPAPNGALYLIDEGVS